MPKTAAKALVIVESPAKANTIARFLGSGFVVESSIGHIRDLPRSAADVPARYKQQPWARLGIDVDNGFKPLYVVPPDKRRQIRKLKDLLAKAEVLYLATDEDREGEAIAWHLYQELKPPKGMDVKRMVFHEITRPAIEAAIAEPRDIDRRLVDAQEARRILDRLYGYEVSPVLWKKVQPRLSAGRVQSVATRIAVERERERMAFVVARYWSLTATFGVPTPVDADAPRDFSAGLATLDGKPVATGSSFTQAGELKRPRHRPPGRERRPHARRGAEGDGVPRPQRGAQAVPPAAGGSVHDLHLPAGGGPQAAHVGHGGHARGAVAVREGLHHLHAHRQHHPLAGGPERRARRHRAAIRGRLPAGLAAPLRQEGQERPGGARSDPAGRRPLPHP